MPSKSRRVRTTLKVVLAVCFVLGLALIAAFLYGRVLEPSSATPDSMLVVMFVILIAFAGGMRLVLDRLFRNLDRYIERRRKPRKRNAKKKPPQTLSEAQVESTCLVSIFVAFIPWGVLLVLVIIPYSIRSMLLIFTLPIYSLFVCHAVVSLILAFRFRFSKPQLKLLAKYILVMDLGFSTVIIASFSPFLIFTQLLFMLGRITVLLSLPLLFAILYVGKRISVKYFQGWFSIKETSPVASSDEPLKLFTKAQHELQRRNYEGAAEAFSFAAWAYADSEKWNEAGEAFQRAADAYSKDKLLQFGSACHYVFAAACFLINQNTEKAHDMMQTANQIITEGKQDKAEKQVSELITFLKLILDGKTPEAQAKWRALEKKTPEWMYPFPDQASNLLEKCLERAQTQQKPEEQEQAEN